MIAHTFRSLYTTILIVTQVIILAHRDMIFVVPRKLLGPETDIDDHPVSMEKENVR